MSKKGVNFKTLLGEVPSALQYGLTDAKVKKPIEYKTDEAVKLLRNEAKVFKTDKKPLPDLSVFNRQRRRFKYGLQQEVDNPNKLRPLEQFNIMSYGDTAGYYGIDLKAQDPNFILGNTEGCMPGNSKYNVYAYDYPHRLYF